MKTVLITWERKILKRNILLIYHFEWGLVLGENAEEVQKRKDFEKFPFKALNGMGESIFKYGIVVSI